MPKLRKSHSQLQQNSISLGNYINLTNDNEQKIKSENELREKMSQKKNKKSQKKVLRKSNKKSINKNIKNVESTNNQDNQLDKSIQKNQKKSQKKQKSKKKSNKKSILNSKEQNLEQNQKEYNKSQQKQKQIDKNIRNNNKLEVFEEEQTKSQIDQNIDFNLRHKKRLTRQKQNYNVLFGRYTEDEDDNSLDQDKNNKFRHQSDIQQFQLLVKKKQKKQKKQKQIKVKNKYFSDISFIPNKIQQNSTEYEQPPENDNELIFERRQPLRKIQHLDKIIQKRVQYVKGRRQFKNVQTDLKYKNHLKKKLQQVQDAEEIQVEVEVPNLFTKKSASAALFMKNNLERQQKNNKLHQSQSNENFQQSLNNFPKKIQNNKTSKQQQFPKNRKKGIKRQDFFNHLVKQIKTKKQTQMSKEEIKECFKKSNLDNELNDQLQEDIISNSGSSDVRKKNFFTGRRLSNDSRGSRKSNQSRQSNKSIKSNNQGRNDDVDYHDLLVSNSRTKPIIGSEVKQNGNDLKQNNKDKAWEDGKDVMNKKIQINFSISEEISNQVSSKVKDSVHLNGKNDKEFEEHKKEVQKQLMNSLRFNTIQIKEELINSLSKKSKFVNKVDEDLDKNLEQKQTEAKSDKIKERSKDGLKQKQKKKKKSKKSKKDKGMNQYFQIEADFSSSEQGHSDTSQNYFQDQNNLDADGNLIDLIDRNPYAYNKRDEDLIRKKFLQEQREQDEKIIEKIMKGMYGKKKYEQSESEKRMKQRMLAAARKNKEIDDDIDEGGQLDKINVIKQSQNEANENENERMQIDLDEKQMRKLKQLQEQLAIGSYIQQLQDIDVRSNANHRNDHWMMISTTLPNVAVPRRSKSGMKKKMISREKHTEGKKMIINRKSNGEQQVIIRKSLDRKLMEMDGNRNKMQKTNKIELDLRNRSVNLQDIQI